MSFKQFLIKEVTKISPKSLMDMHHEEALGLVDTGIDLSAKEIFNLLKNTDVKKIKKNLKEIERSEPPANKAKDGLLISVFYEKIKDEDFYIIEEKVNISKNKNLSLPRVEYFSTIYMGVDTDFNS
jgi:effector-binding domain-containing protein